MRRPLLLFLAFAASLRAGTPEETLQRALARLRATAANLGRYACIETVEREYFQPSPGGCSAAATAPGRLQAVDRLRLEVTVSAGREIYSWPGATRFDSRDVSEIIRQGPIGTGSFGTHLLAVVDNPAVRFEFAGEQTESGRRFLEYRFTVPLGASRYRVRAGAFTQAVAYHGSFRIDPATLELNRLTFRAEQLPEASSMCALDAELDYSPVPAHGDLLLPVRAELRIGFQDLRQTSNLTTFSSCREYKAESELVFDEVPTAGGAAPAAGRAPQISLPIGLPVTLAFTSPIDTAAAAAGDPVDAKVVRPVGRAGSNAIVIPAGATVHGRLTRVERHLTPEPYFVVAVSFNRLDWEGSSLRFAAHSEPTPELLRQLGIGGSEVAGGMRYWDVGVFVFPAAGTRLVIPAGYQTKWFTLAIRGRS